jgi:hypothetical protein
MTFGTFQKVEQERGIIMTPAPCIVAALGGMQRRQQLLGILH